MSYYRLLWNPNFSEKELIAGMQRHLQKQLKEDRDYVVLQDTTTLVLSKHKYRIEDMGKEIGYVSENQVRLFNASKPSIRISQYGGIGNKRHSDMVKDKRVFGRGQQEEAF